MNNEIFITYSEQYDKEKGSLIFCSANTAFSDDSVAIHRFIYNSCELFSKDYNVFLILKGKTQKAISNILNKYKCINVINIVRDNISTVKKDESENYIEINAERIKQIILKKIETLNIKGIFIKPPVLPKQKYFNDGTEFFDKLEMSDQLKNNIIEINNKINSKKLFSYTAFSTKMQIILLDMCKYFYEKYNTPIYQFIIDPSCYYPFLEMECNAKTYYFEDDKRGARNLNQFPMAQLNYLYNYEFEKPMNFLDKTNKFIWGGTILTTKMVRLNDYYNFFHNLNVDNSVLHMSLSNSGFKKQQLPGLFKDEKYEQIINDITMHELYKPILPNMEFEKKLSEYKYTLILKCISKTDSLNFRIIYSLILNVLPFIDSRYDETNIQIPKIFKDKLSVKNSGELNDRIKYYDNNPQEANKLLNDMKEYFIDDKYSNADFYINEFKTKYFTELYK